MSRLFDLRIAAEVLRSPARAVDSCRDERIQRDWVRSCSFLVAIGGAAFGAAVGSFRGWGQAGISALKLPIVTLLTLAIAGPALHAIAGAFGRRDDLRASVTLLLAAGARSALVSLAFAPVLALVIDFGTGYATVRILALVAYALSGASGLSLLVTALGPDAGRRPALALFAAVFLAVGAQSAWLARPYLGDPRDEHVPLFAQGRIEGGLVGALFE